jgi:RHS repeat-associated protein
LSQTQCIGNENLGDSCVSTGGVTVTTNVPLSGIINDLRVDTSSITFTNGTLINGAHLKIGTSDGGTGGDQELIVFNSYDELGQLQAKKVGGNPGTSYSSTQGLQTVDYAYNIRGWLKNINEDAVNDNDLFNFTLRYNDPLAGTPLYNGNISQASWHTVNDDSNVKTYSYSYDPLNRITDAIDDTADNKYSLTNIEYDKNGNIQKLKRNGHTNTGATAFGVMEDLTYSYTGNQLKAVDDDIASSATQGFIDGAEQTTEYTYDTNGNVLTDANKGITDIDYNHWDLPILVDFGNGNNIEYIYDALGNKLRKKVTDLANGNKEADYVGNHVYENGSLKFFTHAEGYVQAEGNGNFSYVYQYKDHLGNVRLLYSDNNNNGSVDSSEIIEEKNYYPFGLNHEGYNAGIDGVYYPYGFNGKEENLEIGLNWLDFSARNYNPEIGRWMNIDPLAENMKDYSTFNYSLNNPIRYIDPDGEDPIDPETGKPYKINLYRSSIIGSTINYNRNNPDNDLLDNINTPFHSLFPRGQRGGDQGHQKGHWAITKDLTTNLISGDARAVVKQKLNLKYTVHAGQNSDPAWNKAANSGTYAFVNPNYAETELGNINLNNAQILSVEDNMINQVINLGRNSNDEFDIESITSFSVEKGEVKTREKKMFFGLITTTEKYRQLNVTETTQNYQNNKANGGAEVSTYSREEVIN